MSVRRYSPRFQRFPSISAGGVSQARRFTTFHPILSVFRMVEPNADDGFTCFSHHRVDGAGRRLVEAGVFNVGSPCGALFSHEFLGGIPDWGGGVAAWIRLSRPGKARGGLAECRVGFCDGFWFSGAENGLQRLVGVTRQFDCEGGW